MKARYNTKLAQAGKSIGGAAAFVRKQILAGEKPQVVKAAVIEKWPKFKRDRKGLTSRINVARKLAKSHALSA